jgi:hypothetical protein
VLAAIFAFPFGLVALWHERELRIVIGLEDAAGGTLVIVHGVAPLAVRRAFADLRSEL